MTVRDRDRDREIMECETGGLESGSLVHVYIRLFLSEKLALNFNPWAEFQTFRHLTPFF